MKMLTMQAFLEIKDWMHRNARPVDLAIWRYHLEGGSAEAVFSELSYYQNSDGGFGRALEPDSWNMESSPYTTLHAIGLLQTAGLLKESGTILQGIFRYLEECPHTSEEGWLFSIPSNDLQAHAPWWTYNREANGFESIGLTAGLSGFVLRYGSRGSVLYERALRYADGVIERLKTPGKYGDMGIGGYCELLDCIQRAGMQNRFDCDFMERTLARQVYDTIQRDTAKWVHYGVRPSNYIHSPQSPYYRANEGIVQAELDYLIDTRPQGGVWPIPWSWFENNEKYPREFAISENWWKAVKATEKVLLLKAFGRSEEV